LRRLAALHAAATEQACRSRLESDEHTEI